VTTQTNALLNSYGILHPRWWRHHVLSHRHKTLTQRHNVIFQKTRNIIVVVADPSDLVYVISPLSWHWKSHVTDQQAALLFKTFGFNYRTWNWLLNWGIFVFLLIPSGSCCAKTYPYPTKSRFAHHSTFRRYTFWTVDRLLRITSHRTSHTCFLLPVYKSMFHAPNYLPWNKINFPTLEILSLIFRSLQRILNTCVYHTAILHQWIPCACLPLFPCHRLLLPHKWCSKFKSSVIPHYS